MVTVLFILFFTSTAYSEDRVLQIPTTRGFGSMFNDLKQFKNPRDNLFNRWMGNDASRLFVTFPESTEFAGIKTYAGFWAHKMKTHDANDPFFLQGDYEFIYYKFRGIDPKGERTNYNLYRLRVNAETVLSEKRDVKLLFRDIEGQQSNFDANYVRGTIGLGMGLFQFTASDFGLAVTGYTGVAIQTTLTDRVPGMEEGMNVPTGASSTTGLEFKFSWKHILGHLKFQFSFFNPQSVFNRYTVRMSIRNILVEGDFVWIQLDSEIPILGSSYHANILFLSYLRKF